MTKGKSEDHWYWNERLNLYNSSEQNVIKDWNRRPLQSVWTSNQFYDHILSHIVNILIWNLLQNSSKKKEKNISTYIPHKFKRNPHVFPFLPVCVVTTWRHNDERDHRTIGFSPPIYITYIGTNRRSLTIVWWVHGALPRLTPGCARREEIDVNLFQHWFVSIILKVPRW